MARIDDVTIEKVLVNKQELDNSLFEYEQSKQRNKFIRSQTRVEYKNKTATEIPNELADLFNKIEQDFMDLNKPKQTFSDYNRIYNDLGAENSLELPLDTLLKMESEFKNKLQTALKSNNVDNVPIEENVSYDLNNIYKWQTVSVTDQSNVNHKQKVQLKPNFDIYTSAYAFFYKTLYAQLVNINK